MVRRSSPSRGGVRRPKGGKSPPGEGTERVFLGLGSNLGRRPDHLRRARRLLEANPEIMSVGASFLYKTSPVGYSAQRDFLNGVVEIRTTLAPESLMARIRGIERRIGKVALLRNGPRKIDIDLILYGKLVMKRKGLILPHPRMHLRKFVLVPLAEIAPAYLHPRLGKRVATLLRECPSGEKVQRWGPW